MQQRFSCTIPALGAGELQSPAVKEKGRFSSVLHRLTMIINKCDDVHSDFRLDFHAAIAHCGLVRRNNVS
jgi:hypothetical protein